MLLSINQWKMPSLKKLSMSNETFMAHVSSRLQEAVRDDGSVVVTVAWNVCYGEEGNKRKKIDGEPFGRLTACCYTEERHVFLTNSETNLIYEENIANPPTVEVILTLRTCQMSSSFEKSPSIFSFVLALELVDFIWQAAKLFAQYSKISVDGSKQLLLVKETKFGLLTVRIRQLSVQSGGWQDKDHRAQI